MENRSNRHIKVNIDANTGAHFLDRKGKLKHIPEQASSEEAPSEFEVEDELDDRLAHISVVTRDLGTDDDDIYSDEDEDVTRQWEERAGCSNTFVDQGLKEVRTSIASQGSRQGSGMY